MKKRILYRGWIGLASCLLCLLTLGQTPVRAAQVSLDYGRGTENDRSLMASELFEAILGETEAPLTEAERSALDGLLGVMLRYNDSVPPQLVDRGYDGDLGEFTVRAQGYAYTAENGTEVLWVPTQASIDGREPRPFEEKNGQGEYVCVFDGVWNSDEIAVSVDYAWQVEIPVETVNGLLTLPYTVGQEALDALSAYDLSVKDYENAWAEYYAYEDALRAFNEKKAAFDLFENYKRQKAARENYLIEKAAFDDAVKAFEDYKKKKEAYDKAESDFYYYERKRQEYATIYDQYEPYLKGLEDMQTRLELMESMFLSDSNGWQFYSGVMGGTVDSVIANRHKLETVALVDGKVIDNAKKATERLRPLLKGYQELRLKTYDTDLARNQALFEYYAAHYEEIRDSVSLLYHSVHTIYGNSGVVTGMSTDAEAKKKQPHFRQFLAQLYLLYCALDQTAVPDPSWLLSKYDKWTYMELVEEKLYLPVDINPSPEGVSVPSTEIKLPDDLPEPVEKPIKDFEDVEDPYIKGEPTYVKDPGDPPPEAEDPGDPPPVVDPPALPEPTAPALSIEARALASELKKGMLPQRQARADSLIFKRTKTVTRSFYIDNRKTVSFYDHAGNLIETVMVEYGEAVASPNVSRAPDEVYSAHVFLGWLKYGETDIANRVSLQSVTTDLILVPKYESTKRIYEITWVVDGTQSTTTHHWGEMPTCPLSTEKTDPKIEYTFTGWSPTLTSVQGNATYVAQYAESPRLCQVTWSIGGRIETSWVEYGKVPACSFSTNRAPDDYLYQFTGWDQNLRAVTGDVTYTAQYKKTPLATYNDGSACRVEHDTDFITVLAEKDVVCFTNASQYAGERGLSLRIRWGNVEITLTPEILKSYESSRCTKLQMKQSAGAFDGCIAFGVTCLNDRGIPIAVGKKLPVRVYNTPEARKYAMAYRVKGTELTPLEITRYADGRAEWQVDSGAEVEYRSEYRVAFADPREKCNVSAFPQSAAIGSEILLNANCEYGYEISSAVLRYADGREVTVTEKSFRMEKDLVSVEVQVTPITYRVQFVVEGTVISEQIKLFGESIEIPADPEKAEDALYTYAFAGWTPYVAGATTGENRNPVYTASFTRTAKAPVVSPNEEVKDPFMKLLVTILIAIAVLIAATVTLAIVFRRRLKLWILAAWKGVKSFFARLFAKREEAPMRASLSVRKQKSDKDKNS